MLSYLSSIRAKGHLGSAAAAAMSANVFQSLLRVRYYTDYTPILTFKGKQVMVIIIMLLVKNQAQKDEETSPNLHR